MGRIIGAIALSVLEVIALVFAWVGLGHDRPGFILPAVILGVLAGTWVAILSRKPNSKRLGAALGVTVFLMGIGTYGALWLFSK